MKNKKGIEGPTTEHLCFLNGLTTEFSQLQDDCNSHGNNSIHIIQSWSPSESKTLSKEKTHQMGIALIERFAPGHQYVVQTHTEEAHNHNHIVLNPVSIETGKRIQNKLEHIRTLRNLNDDIARENGLTVLPPQEKLRKSGPNEISRRIDTYRGRSYILDLASKADFARSHATNYDEYVSLLNSFDIQVRVEPKNITYFYPGREHGKRGKNLGPRLDKDSLEKVFISNQERLSKLPEKIRTNPRTTPANNLSDLVSSRSEGVSKPRQEQLDNSEIPIAEIQRAKSQSILKYCEKNRISLKQDDQGKTVLDGREYVEVTDHQWFNHRNKTRGNIIDFVSSHKQTGYLNAIAELTANPKLLLLNSGRAEQSQRFQSFYIPKEDPAPRHEAIQALSKILGHPSDHPIYNELFKRQVVHVTKSGAVRFFSEKSPTGYLEFTPAASGAYQASRKGRLHSPFYSRKAQGRKLVVSIDPIETLRQHPDAFLQLKKSRDGAIMLFDPNLSAVSRAVAENRTIKNVVLLGGKNDHGPAPENIMQFFNEMKKAFDPFSIETELMWNATSEKPFERKGDFDLGISRER